MRSRNEPSHVAITTISMAMLIVVMGAVIFKQSFQDKAIPPVVIQKTEIIRQTRYPNISPIFTTGTYRVRCTAKSLTFGIVEQTQSSVGSAFGMDLTEWGFKGKKYLLTAAHVVLQKAAGTRAVLDRPVDKVEIQIRTDKIKRWVNCRIIFIDKDRDAALLEADEEIPVVFKLGEKAEIGSSIILAGCPVGTTPQAVFGIMTSMDPEIDIGVRCQVWQVSAPFYFGNSGGPVFDPETDLILGIVVAGVSSKTGDLIPHLALMIPCFEVRKMLNAKYPPLAPRAEVVLPPAEIK